MCFAIAILVGMLIHVKVQVSAINDGLKEIKQINLLAHGLDLDKLIPEQHINNLTLLNILIRNISMVVVNHTVAELHAKSKTGSFSWDNQTALLVENLSRSISIAVTGNVAEMLGWFNRTTTTLHEQQFDWCESDNDTDCLVKKLRNDIKILESVNAKQAEEILANCKKPETVSLLRTSFDHAMRYLVWPLICGIVIVATWEVRFQVIDNEKPIFVESATIFAVVIGFGIVGSLLGGVLWAFLAVLSGVACAWLGEKIAEDQCRKNSHVDYSKSKRRRHATGYRHVGDWRAKHCYDCHWSQHSCNICDSRDIVGRIGLFLGCILFKILLVDVLAMPWIGMFV